MTEKKFTELAHKHLVVLESYQKDENGNSQFNIFGYKQLYEAITVTHCCKSDSEQLQAVEDLKEFARNNCREWNVEEMEEIIDRL